MKEHNYFVYIVCSNSGTLYIGMTNDICRRALQHKRGEVDGFAAKYRCDRLVYYESFDEVGKAIESRKAIETVGQTKEARIDRSAKPALGGPGREMESGDALREPVNIRELIADLSS